MTAAAPRNFTWIGRWPTQVVAIQVARAASRSGALWGVVFALYVAAQTLAYISAYPTQAERDQLARSLGGNIGINALIGPARAIDTAAGYASWRAVGILSVLGAIWGLLTATRLLRGEEEAGRQELLLAGWTTRRRAGAQSVGGLGFGLLALFVPTLVGTVLTGHAAAVDFGPGASVYFAVTLVAGAALFLAIGALTSQLANTRRRAASMAAVVFGISYALRMVADSDPRVHWMVWLSPLGWVEETRPLTDPNPWALLPVAVLIIVAVAATVHLAGVRDLGAAVLPDRDTAPPHLRSVSGPAALVIRLMSPTASGWLLAIIAYSLLIGTVAVAATKTITGNNTLEQALARLGGRGTLVEAFLGLVFVMLAMIVALVAAGQITALRAEEAEG